MDPIMWKKLRELRNSPARLIGAVLLSFAVMFLTVRFADPLPESFVWSYPLAVCSVCGFLLYSLDDVTHASLYEALGIGMKRVWLCNLVFTSAVTIIISELMLTQFNLLGPGHYDPDDCLYNLASFPAIFAVIALSTVHYGGGTKWRLIGASTFGALVLLMILMPFATANIELSLPFVGIVALISAVIVLVVYRGIGRYSSETIVINAQDYAKIYDDAFSEY